MVFILNFHVFFESSPLTTRDGRTCSCSFDGQSEISRRYLSNANSMLWELYQPGSMASDGKANDGS